MRSLNKKDDSLNLIQTVIKSALRSGAFVVLGAFVVSGTFVVPGAFTAHAEPVAPVASAVPVEPDSLSQR